MSAKNAYNTKSRKYILDFLQKNNTTTVSVADIMDYLTLNGISVNLSTVYRYLNKLTLEQKAVKFTDESGQKALYQLANESKTCEEHIHTQCIKCGNLIHLDCHFMDELRNHLYDNHGFTLTCKGSILYGICEECAK